MRKIKKLVKEDLNRFNQIMNYDQRKGLIKEEGDQLSFDFPYDSGEVEDRILTNINKIIEVLESRPKWLPSFLIVRNDEGEVSSDFSLRNTLAGIKRGLTKFETDLKQGLLKKNKESYGYRHRQTQKTLGFYGEEINDFGALIDLVNDTLTDIRSLGLDYEYYYGLQQLIKDYGYAREREALPPLSQRLGKEHLKGWDKVV